MKTIDGAAFQVLQTESETEGTVGGFMTSLKRTEYGASTQQSSSS